MSERQAALLRGINVGKAKRISMAELKKMMEKLGFTEVKTLLNSGNVVYTSKVPAAAAAARIEKALVAEIGVAANVMVLTAKEVAAVVRGNVLAKVTDNPSRLMVAVLRDPRDAAKLKPVVAKKWGADRIALGPGVVYVWCPNSLLDSPIYAELNRLLKDGVTSRNWATTLKLAALLGVDSN